MRILSKNQSYLNDELIEQLRNCVIKNNKSGARKTRFFEDEILYSKYYGYSFVYAYDFDTDVDLECPFGGSNLRNAWEDSAEIVKADASEHYEDNIKYDDIGEHTFESFNYDGYSINKVFSFTELSSKPSVITFSVILVPCYNDNIFDNVRIEDFEIYSEDFDLAKFSEDDFIKFVSSLIKRFSR